MNTHKQIGLMVALLFLFVGGCAAYSAVDLPIRAVDQQQWTKDQSLERGALLFANNCRTCHGNTGEGGVGPQLRANDKTKFQDQDPLVLAANHTILQRTLSCGRAGTLMPAWLNTNGGALNAIQIQHLVDFLTYPVAENADGEVTNKWWGEAEEFAHNLNAEVAVLVGGDTLGGIAKSHGIGPKELAAANNLPVEGILKQGTELKMPGFKGDPNGYTYTAYKDNETITKIAEAHFVGALILADLNGIDYTFSEKRGVATFALKKDGVEIAGLFPGDVLKLPAGATYTINAGDTKDSIAQQHSLSVSELESLNKNLDASLADDKELPFENTLTLPKQTAIVQEGQTLAAIATAHGVKAEDLATENNIAADAVVAVGTALKLPDGAKYVVQTGDTWERAAAEHATTPADLAAANGLKTSDPLQSVVILQLPQIDKFLVKGQNLEAIAEGYGNVTAQSLASKNNIQPTSVLRIGTQLHLPDDAFGSKAPDAKNTGTGCVQYTVSNGAYETLIGGGSAAVITPPPTQSKEVRIDAHANDWTVVADGVAQPANKGVVSIAKGTAVLFDSVVGLHTITLNGKKDGADIKQGDKRTITFNDAGQFKITCDYHPDMLADVFVQ